LSEVTQLFVITCVQHTGSHRSELTHNICEQVPALVLRRCRRGHWVQISPIKPPPSRRTSVTCLWRQPLDVWRRRTFSGKCITQP